MPFFKTPKSHTKGFKEQLLIGGFRPLDGNHHSDLMGLNYYYCPPFPLKKYFCTSKCLFCFLSVNGLKTLPCNHTVHMDHEWVQYLENMALFVSVTYALEHKWQKRRTATLSCLFVIILPSHWCKTVIKCDMFFLAFTDNLLHTSYIIWHFNNYKLQYWSKMS